jgi:hypothetical protein
MTAKDYWRIADALHKARFTDLPPEIARNTRIEGIDLAAEYIADELSADNPRFDRHRFLSAVWGVGVIR